MVFFFFQSTLFSPRLSRYFWFNTFINAFCRALQKLNTDIWLVWILLVNCLRVIRLKQFTNLPISGSEIIYTYALFHVWHDYSNISSRIMVDKPDSLQYMLV